MRADRTRAPATKGAHEAQRKRNRSERGVTRMPHLLTFLATTRVDRLHLTIVFVAQPTVNASRPPGTDTRAQLAPHKLTELGAAGLS